MTPATKAGHRTSIGRTRRPSRGGRPLVTFNAWCWCGWRSQPRPAYQEAANDAADHKLKMRFSLKK